MFFLEPKYNIYIAAAPSVYAIMRYKSVSDIQDDYNATKPFIQKLYVSNTNGSSLINTDHEGSFSFDGVTIVGLEFSTTLNINKYDLTLAKTAVTTTLATDHVSIAGFAVGTKHYHAIQSASDNNVKLLTFDTSDNSYSTVVLAIAYNTVAKFFRQNADGTDYAFIHDTSGNVWRIDVTTSTELQMRRVSLTTDTVESKFDTTGTLENIDTNGLHDDPCGPVQGV